jgi:3-deoxy-7-phosphoheptulonate synthase
MQLPDIQTSALRCGLSHTPAAQQPPWRGHPELGPIRAELAELPALVDDRDTRVLRERLALVEAGSAFLLHVGECAELFSMANRRHVEQRISLYRRMAERLAERTGREVVLVTRMAGQHAKPRSEDYTAQRDGSRILNYRGDMVNRLDATATARQADPERLLTSYWRSRETLAYLRHRNYGGLPIFVSHEALLRDYEEPMTRGSELLHSGSGHFVWIGERTRNPWNWHVQWAALISNPVGVKLGPSATARNVVELVQALNPWRERGRLSLIARMGTAQAEDRLASMMRAVSYTRSPVLWQCDPMHGNTRKRDGTKVRYLADLRAEVSTFVRTLHSAGFHPGGLHLEVTPEEVLECHENASSGIGHASNPPCDPRLNFAQAMEMVDHFADEISGKGSPR